MIKSTGAFLPMWVGAGITNLFQGLEDIKILEKSAAN